ncbi:MAG: ferrous iron transport protein B [Ignisphaera sp.]
MSELRREQCNIVVAVVGQPNVGKSTLFNVLTGRRERVGNFPGTTVAMSIGRRRYGDKTMCFVDLPGIYDLKAVSLDEKIARDYIVFGDWDAILILVDLTRGLEGLYLALQVLQLTDRAVVALTKWDEVTKRRIRVDLDGLSRILGVPVVPISALRGEGIEDLLKALESVVETSSRKAAKGIHIDYGSLENTLNSIVKEVTNSFKSDRIDPRGLVALIARGNIDIAEKIGLSHIARVLEDTAKSMNIDVGEHIAESIYRFIRGTFTSLIAIEPLERFEKKGFAYKVFGNPYTGFVATVATLFSAIFIAFAVNTGFPFTTILEALGRSDLAEALESYTISGLISQAFDYLKNWVQSSLGSTHPVLASLLANGIIEGVGVVSSFIPLIMITMMIMSAIEDSGLGPLMAISMHSLFAKFGLSGRAIYPLFISLGCNVPGVMASRAALDDAERFEIIAAASFIPCQARLIVMLALVGFLFPGNPALQALVVIGVYFGGALLYLLTAKIFRRGVLRVSTPPELILELPSLHRPSLKVVWWDSWSLTKHFIVRAGTVLVLLVAVVWALTSFGPEGFVEDPSQSWASNIGRLIGYVIKPLYGLSEDSSWKIGFALLTGFIAKENLLASIAVMTGAEEYQSALQALGLTVAQGIAILVLFMYYVPCLATVSMIYAESKSIRFTLLVVAYIVAVALLASLLVYGTAILLQH